MPVGPIRTFSSRQSGESGKRSLQHAEFLGVPGSGKSTLIRALIESDGKSRRILALEEAARLSLSQFATDRLTKLAATCLRSADNRIWKALYARSPERTDALIRFVSAWPLYLEAILAAQQERADRDVNQDVVLRWILELGAKFDLVGRVLSDEEVVVIDEGFAQRAVATFGHGWASEDLPLLVAYIDSMPRPDLVILVDTPIDVCRQRLDLNKWPVRAVHLSPDERLRYLSAAGSVVEEVAGRLAKSGTSVVRVEGATQLEKSVAHILRLLD